MKVQKLIEELSELPEDAEVVVWDGYNAGSITYDFDVAYDWATRVVTLE